MPNTSYLTLRSVLNTLDSCSAGSRLPQDVEDAFFSLLKVGNNVAKKTHAHRLDEVNEIVNRLLPNCRPLRMMDVGISSGVSTLEWVESLEPMGIDYHMHAVDLMVRGILVGLREGVDVLADVSGRPLLIDLHGQWIPYLPGKRQLIRYFFQLLIITGAMYLIASQVSSDTANGNKREARRWFTASAAPLVYSELRNHPLVTVTVGNLFEPASLPGSLHVVRAANLLNRGYFSDTQLSTIVRNLRGTLCGNGLLIICKTDDSGKTEGTVFVLKENGSFDVVRRINGGSEIEDLVCSAEIMKASQEQVFAR